MQSDDLLLLVVMIVATVIYYVPSMVAIARKVPSRGSVIVVNFFFGWTFVGWVVALAMAARSSKNVNVVINGVPGAAPQMPLPPTMYQPFAPVPVSAAHLPPPPPGMAQLPPPPHVVH